MNFPTLAFCAVLWSAGGIGLAQTPRVNPNADTDGQALVAQLLAQEPAQDLTNRAVLRIRAGRGPWQEQPVLIRIFATPRGWTSIYETVAATNQPPARLTIVRRTDGRQEYRLAEAPQCAGSEVVGKVLTGAETMVPFAGSDFWIADLGLEFLRWPTQRLLRSELRRGQSCDVLESVAPPAATNGYVRVLSWIDRDTGGIVYAEAFDATGKIMKEFLPKTVRKIQGRWELEEMEIINRRTGSRSRLVFELERK